LTTKKEIKEGGKKEKGQWLILLEQRVRLAGKTFGNGGRFNRTTPDGNRLTCKTAVREAR